MFRHLHRWFPHFTSSGEATPCLSWGKVWPRTPSSACFTCLTRWCMKTGRRQVSTFGTIQSRESPAFWTPNNSLQIIKRFWKKMFFLSMHQDMISQWSLGNEAAAEEANNSQLGLAWLIPLWVDRDQEVTIITFMHICESPCTVKYMNSGRFFKWNH